MDKRRLYRNIAKKAGIKDPEIEYHQGRQAYSIGITMRTPDGKGFYAPSIGLYYSVQEAEKNIANDLKAFLQKYPEAKDKETFSYKTVTNKEISRLLLESLIDHRSKLSPDELREFAQATLKYIEELEAAMPRDRENVKYISQTPQAKKDIDWEQPSARQAPLYHFEITCDYCGRQTSLESFSPRQPGHCGLPDCAYKHERKLANERQRRYRENQKAKRDE